MLLGVTMRQNILENERRRGFRLLSGAVFFVLMFTAVNCSGQAPGEQADQSAKASARPIAITLEEAIRRAEANEPAYAASSAESRASALDRSIARAGLLPNAVYHNQALYTQTNRGQTTPRFIANNALREYTSQAVVNETLGLGLLASVQRADAAAARATAELEIARRGLKCRGDRPVLWRPGGR